MDYVQPTILTVEKAAAAKIYLETHFNELLKGRDTRELRHQQLETQLYYSPHLKQEQKDACRSSFFQQETWHLREQRVLKSESQAAARGQTQRSSYPRYEAVKVLGKGSFGVVRLVRETPRPGITASKQVFAMKVIRKSDMLRSSQEGHLRAERDFLVASQGSQW
jgi:protein-serine/threonine kinase